MHSRKGTGRHRRLNAGTRGLERPEAYQRVRKGAEIAGRCWNTVFEGVQGNSKRYRMDFRIDLRGRTLERGRYVILFRMFESFFSPCHRTLCFKGIGVQMADEVLSL